MLPALVPWRAAEVAVGHVRDAAGPVAGARVRWQGHPSFVLSAADGSFRLPGGPIRPTRVTASKPGYRIAAAEPTMRPLDLRLEPLPAEDNESYAWIDPHPDPSRPTNCGNCHEEIHREWAGSAHARSARNPKFLQVLADPDGKSPPGWDLSREHPLGIGVCATCHAPTLGATGHDDVRRAVGVATTGVHCDYCHKVVDAPTDKLGLRFGADGLVLRRPKGDDLLVFGPLEDAVRPGESFAHQPVYRESRFCAPCHEGTVFGVHVYGTYSEWLRSPARAQGVQCQGCHMSPTGSLTNLAPSKGGVARDPATLASHGFPGGQADLIRRCVQVEATCRPAGEGMRVDVILRAEHVGHRVPTGFVDRHLVLVVQAFDEAGHSVEAIDGPRLPPAAGTWAGRPGRLFAKLLRGEHGEAPLPFWAPGSDVQDTRLLPGHPERQAFHFPHNAARVEVRLWYRRFWQQIADARGWTDNDLLVFKRTMEP
jgi:hypothetical protein